MADSYFPTLISKDKDPNTASNVIFVNLSDGSGNAATYTTNALNVNVANTVTVSGSVTVSGTVTATTNYEYAEDTAHQDGDIGAFVMAVRKDTAAAVAGDGDYIPLIVDANGKLYVNAEITLDSQFVDDALFTTGTDKVLAFGAIFDDTATDQLDENDIGLLRCTQNRELKVDISAQSLTAVKISRTTAANSETNPIFVQAVKGATSGEEVQNYDTSTVGGGNPDNHDYAVAGTTFMLTSVIAASSGGMKFEIQTGPLATLATVAVGFIPKAGGTHQLFFDPPVEVPVTSTGTIRVIRTNRESASQDVYSTIIGYDL